MTNLRVVVVLLSALTFAAHGCGGSGTTGGGGGGGDGDGGMGGGAGGGSGGGSGGGAGGGGGTGGGTGGGGGSGNCTPLTCDDIYDDVNDMEACGATNPDGCGDLIPNCGACEGSLYCETQEDGFSRCVEPPPLPCPDPLTMEEACADIDGKLVCGNVTNGCSGEEEEVFDCGGCDGTDICGNGGAGPRGEALCGPAGSCTPSVTCESAGAECGIIGNGCDGTINCTTETGGCTGGEVCNFTTHQCEPPPCTPHVPAVACAGKCGTISNGCDGFIDCSAPGNGGEVCEGLETCGGGETPNECGSGPACVPHEPEEVCAGKCGAISDGCDDVIDCSAPGNGGEVCTNNEICGGANVPNECGLPPCDALTFAEACTANGLDCGEVSNGCGDTIDCGDCTGSDVCGLSQANVCGTPACSPTPVALACAGKCGDVPNGCGGQWSCNSGNGGLTCPQGQWCGGGGEPNECGAPECVASTCEDLGFECGYAGDGCGNVLNCWPNPSDPECPAANEACIGNPAVCVAGTGGGGGCTGPLCDDLPSCGGTPTTVTGRVTTPDGELGIPNAIVYIPRDPSATLPAITTGPSCDRCADEDLGPVLASAVTDHTGAFTLTGNIPIGTDFRIVTKIGKWRRVVNISSNVLAGCTANNISNTYTRMPAHKSDGLTGTHMPRIAIATGSADAMECVFYKMGISQAEFTARTGTGRIHVYRDNGARLCAPSSNPCTRTGGTGTNNPCDDNNAYESRANCEARSGQGSGDYDTCTWQDSNCDGTPTADFLEDSVTTNGHFNDYDMVVWDCEGQNHTNRSSTQEAMMNTYTDNGGRFFASHFSYEWIYQDTGGSDGMGDSASWGGSGSEGSGTGRVSIGRPRANATRIETFARWLDNENAADITYDGLGEPTAGTFTITDPRDFATSVNSGSEEWVYRTDGDPNPSVQQFSFNTPYGSDADNICGRIAYTGFHVAGSVSPSSSYFPAVCGDVTELTPQEKILAYMLFDLAACVSEGEPPQPPECTALTEEEACPADACGIVPDGCGDVWDCGGCPVGEYCAADHTCVEPNCDALDCSDYGANCGTLPDGCGNTIHCGDCTGNQICGYSTPNVCGQPTCDPLSCEELGANCGAIGDGCGSSIDCGVCDPGETCGGGGPNVCGPGSCNAMDCDEQMFDCGLAGDGCGNVISCGECDAPDTCGGLGEPNVCGHPDCNELDCDDRGAECGWIGDGCGGAVNCGPCENGGVCGGAGPNLCGDPCVPTTCEAEGAGCGAISNGCGGVLQCGICEGGTVCGGGGTPNQCGVGTCEPRDCEEAGAECGLVGDGCGQTINCGTCEARPDYEPGDSCGGSGIPNVCGPGMGGCEPASCESLEAECGALGDGCGNLLDCGGCPSGEFCGILAANRCDPFDPG